MKFIYTTALCLLTLGMVMFMLSLSVIPSLQSAAKPTSLASIQDINLQNLVSKQPSVPSHELEDLFVEIIVEPEPLPEPLFKIVLPTENEAIYHQPADFYMHTNRYKNGINLRPWQGGGYGFVRTPLKTGIGIVHTKLHEGIDIRPLRRDSKNIPLDEVKSISDGVVCYVNSRSGGSNYGKYIVVKHSWPDGDFFSLYAHLAKTNVSSRQKVKAGDTLGILGYTGRGIDRERAHVHVELAFMTTDRYNTSYSPGNGHYNYNGLNLIGIDVGRFLRKYRENPRFTMREFLDEEEPYYTVRTTRAVRPGILKRHPWLGRNMDLAPKSKSWEITFARTWVPIWIEPSEKSQRSAIVTWVKPMKTNHSYMTGGRLTGSGDYAKLSSSGHRFIKLLSEAF